MRKKKEKENEHFDVEKAKQEILPEIANRFGV